MTLLPSPQNNTPLDSIFFFKAKLERLFFAKIIGYFDNCYQRFVEFSLNGILNRVVDEKNLSINTRSMCNSSNKIFVKNKNFPIGHKTANNFENY